MDAIIEKMLQAKGVSDFLEIHGVDTNKQVYGYFDTDRLFHICDSDINELELKSLFKRRYIIIRQTTETYVVEKRIKFYNDHLDFRNNYPFLLDTETRRFVIGGFSYQKSRNGRFLLLFNNRGYWSLGKSDYSTRMIDAWGVKNSLAIICDHLCEIESFLVLNNFTYVLTQCKRKPDLNSSFCTYYCTLYDKNGRILRVFPDNYYLEFAVSFEDEESVLFMQNEEKSLMYWCKKDILTERSFCFAGESRTGCYFDGNRALFYKDGRGIIFDSNGTILRELTTYGSIENYKNGIIKYSLPRGTFYFESTDERVTGSCDNYHCAVLYKEMEDSRSFSGLTKRAGLIKIDDMSLIIPFEYDDIFFKARDVWHDNQWFTFGMSIVLNKDKNGILKEGLYKDDRVVMPLSEGSIDAITYESQPDDEEKYAGYYCKTCQDGHFIIYHCATENSYECDAYKLKFITEFTNDFGDNPYLVLRTKNQIVVIVEGVAIYSFSNYSDVDYLGNGYFYVYDDFLRKGVFEIKKGEIIPPTFRSLRRYVEDYFIADDCLFSISGEKIFGPENLGVHCGIKYLFSSHNIYALCRNNLYDLDGDVLIDASAMGLQYICGSCSVLCYSNPNRHFIFFSFWGDQLTEGEDYEDYVYDNQKYYAFSEEVEKNLLFNIEDEFFLDKEELEFNHHDYYEEQYDYEEDTYYALGGDDYQRFKENGGSIDDMMDGMGL